MTHERYEEEHVGRVRFVLVQPGSSGNVGSSARALKNLGFSRLVLVGARCDPADAEARKLAVDGRDVLLQAEQHQDLDRALAGACTVVGTSGRKGKHRRPHWRIDELAPELVRLARQGDLAVLFGREDHGLTDAELDRCTHLVYLPTAAAYRSFNLAHAVLLVAYELHRAAAAPDRSALAEPARHETREAMYTHLEQALLEIGYLSRDTAEVIMRRWRRMFGRAALSEEEVQLLRGAARQMLWSARRGGLPAGDDVEPD